jgi:hypothetical protein
MGKLNIGCGASGRPARGGFWDGFRLRERFLIADSASRVEAMGSVPLRPGRSWFFSNLGFDAGLSIDEARSAFAVNLGRY